MPENTDQGSLASWLKGQFAGGMPQMTIGGNSQLGQMMMNGFRNNPEMFNGYIDQVFGNMQHPAANFTMPQFQGTQPQQQFPQTSPMSQFSPGTLSSTFGNFGQQQGSGALSSILDNPAYARMRSNPFFGR